MGMHVRLVGAFAVIRDGRTLSALEVGSRKSRMLLAFLATTGARTVPVDQLVAVLWPGRPPRHPAENVATLVSRVRATLGPDVITGGRGGYRLGDAVSSDLSDVDRQLSDPGDLAAAQRAAQCLESDLVLAGEPDADWVAAARERQAALLRRARRIVAATGPPALARDAAEAAVRADEFDEDACRSLMRAYDALGEPARALAAFERLRSTLADELGADPAGDTQDLHVAILRGAHPVSGELPGRDRELAVLDRAWHAASAGRGELILISGEAGIGKTRLAEEVARHSAGARVLTARCYEAERSLFLQPVVEVLTGLLATLPAGRVRAAAGDRADALAALVPEVATLLGAPAREHGSPEVQRRRAYDAVVVFLRRLAADTPVLLVIDDLHQAGTATVELLHYLARHITGARLLVLATTREVPAALATRTTIELGALDTAAITRLAEAAGQVAHVAQIERRTRGHTLFVVESLRALAAGEPGVPDTLRAGVLARVARAGAPAEELLRAAAVLGASFAPATVAGLLGIPAAEATLRCERLLATRLTVVAGRSYEFANDLVQEVLYGSTPEPTRLAHHLRAADLLADRPEAVARHAEAGGDDRRAARAWLAAGRTAAGRYAMADAEALLAHAITTAQRAGDDELLGRARLARGRVCETGLRFEEALADYTVAARTGREIGDRRLEMAALRELGGPAWAGSGRSGELGADHVRHGLRLAEQLGDRGAEAELHGWLAVLNCNQLRFVDAARHSRLAQAAAAASGDERAELAALDARKTIHAYLGEVTPLGAVLDELEPRVRRAGDLHLLQWCVFESAFPQVAAGNWRAAADLFDEAIRINARSGYTGYTAWFVAHQGWRARLAGQVGEALELGERAARMESHAWFTTAVHAMWATTLIGAGEVAAAVPVLERGMAVAETHHTVAYRLRCLAPLAEATGSAEVLREADAVLRDIQGPPWLYGSDVYLSVARAWRARGDHHRADEILGPVLAAGRRHGWTAPLQSSSASIAAALSAPSVSTGR